MKFMSLQSVIFRIAFVFLAGITGFSSRAQVINTVAGNGTAGYTGDGGQATAAELNAPEGVYADTLGNFYVADYAANCIRKISASGIITTVAGNGTAGFSGDGGQATAAELNSPSNIVLDHAGNLLIADFGNNRLRKVTPAGIITTIAGTGVAGYSGDGGAATLAQLDSLDGVAVDTGGNIYIADYNNNCIRKIKTTGIISTIAGNGTSGYSGDGGPATAAELSYPSGMAIDPSGNIYTAELGNNCIRKVNPAGIISTIAGNTTGGYSGDGGPATAAELNVPYDVAADRSGNLFVADEANNCIRKISSAGIISTIAGTSTSGYTGDGGPATAGQMYGPGGVSVTKWGYVYIGDQGNSVVRMVDTCRFPYVASITGAVTLCSGATIHLADSTPGGAWSSGATTIATIGSTGIVTGISGGAVSISYSLTNSCGATTSSVLAITVNTVPSAGAISGADTVCAGDTISLTDPSAGGNWYSTNTSISTITVSGMAIGVSGGTATIQYIETNMCGSDTATYAVTVLPASECPSGVKGIGNAPTPTLSVFPNPNPGAFTFHLLSPINEGAQISITNLLGEKVREMTITTNQEYEMQLTTPGIYFLNAVNFSGTLTLSKKIEVY